MSAVKHLVRQFLPPIAVDGLRWVRSRVGGGGHRHDPPEWEAVADSDAIWITHAGWSHDSIVETQRRKWPAFLASVSGPGPFGASHEGGLDGSQDVGTHNTIMSFAYALARGGQGRELVRVLDWGGGLGHYFVYAQKLFPDMRLDYAVKDLPAMCEAGRALLPQVRFVADDAEALNGRYDIVFASSSVQYARDLYGLLGQLCDASAHWLMVTRSPFVWTSDDFVVVQRPHAYGYHTEYPCWFINRKRFVDFVCGRGFSLEREFIVAESPYVPNAPERGRFRGFLFRRQGA